MSFTATWLEPEILILIKLERKRQVPYITCGIQNVAQTILLLLLLFLERIGSGALLYSTGNSV